MSEEDKISHHQHLLHHHHEHHHHEEEQQPPPPPPPPPEYGTFQAPSMYPPPQPALGFPQPVPPPGAFQPSAPHPPHPYVHAYQTVQGYSVNERPHGRERRLPCCGIGCGWCLFIIGFFLAAIPWYVGAIMLLCGKYDQREKPGYIACIIAAVLATIAVILGVSKNDW